MSTYGWIITKDHIADDLGSVDHEEAGAANLLGPRGIPDEYREALAAGRGASFRLLDDDREVYFDGLIVGAFEGFEPLDDYGMPHSGCTTIQYQNEHNQWEDL